jgi:hypothetical protein
MDFGEHEVKRPLRFLFRMPWGVEHRRPDRPRSRFLGRGGGWVVAQFIFVACWLLLTPKGNKLTGSALAPRLRGGLADRRGGPWRLRCAGAGQKPDALSEAAREGATRPARDLRDDSTPALRGVDRAQFRLGVPVVKRPGRSAGTGSDGIARR